jgi:hypothetical protein
MGKELILLKSLLIVITVVLSPAIAEANSARIVKVAVHDQGAPPTSPRHDIDVIQDDCDPDPDNTSLEPFFDTMLSISVVNNLNRDISFHRFGYNLRFSSFVQGRKLIRAKRQGIAGNFLSQANGKQTDVYVFMLRNINGRKYSPSGNFMIPEEAGFTNLRLRLIGRTDDGKIVRLRSNATVSIRNHDRC